MYVWEMRLIAMHIKKSLCYPLSMRLKMFNSNIMGCMGHLSLYVIQSLCVLKARQGIDLFILRSVKLISFSPKSSDTEISVTYLPL